MKDITCYANRDNATLAYLQETTGINRFALQKLLATCKIRNT